MWPGNLVSLLGSLGEALPRAGQVARLTGWPARVQLVLGRGRGHQAHRGLLLVTGWSQAASPNSNHPAPDPQPTAQDASSHEPSPEQPREGAGLRSAPESSHWVSSWQDVSTGARWAGAEQGRASQSKSQRLERPNARPCARLLLASIRPAAGNAQLSPTFPGQSLEAQGWVPETGSEPRVRLQGPEKPGQLGGADSEQDTGAMPVWVRSWGLSLR